MRAGWSGSESNEIDMARRERLQLRKATQMIELHASIAAHQVMRAAVNSARPDAPIRPGDVLIGLRSGVVAARQRLSKALRRLADAILPLGGGTISPLPASR